MHAPMRPDLSSMANRVVRTKYTPIKTAPGVPWTTPSGISGHTKGMASDGCDPWTQPRYCHSPFATLMYRPRPSAGSRAPGVVRNRAISFKFQNWGVTVLTTSRTACLGPALVNVSPGIGNECPTKHTANGAGMISAINIDLPSLLLDQSGLNDILRQDWNHATR